MEWRRLFIVISTLGIVLIIWGTILYVANRPLTSDGNLIRAAATDVYNYSENRRRDDSRKTAMYLALGGTLVLFAGLGGIVFARKN